LRKPYLIGIGPPKNRIRRSIPPTATDERTIVLLCWRRAETKPDPITTKQYPREFKRKREPASSCPIFKSFSIAGIKGERMIRERKFKK
jgi:hypothetical protein